MREIEGQSVQQDRKKRPEKGRCNTFRGDALNLSQLQQKCCKALLENLWAWDRAFLLPMLWLGYTSSLRLHQLLPVH